MRPLKTTFSITIAIFLLQVIAAEEPYNYYSGGVQESFITGEPIGEIAVAKRLDIELHAYFMASRTFSTESVLNWYNLGYSGGGEYNQVGGNFGDFGLHFPHYERESKYPVWIKTDVTPAVVFNGNNVMKANFPVEKELTGNGSGSIEVWVLNESLNEDEIILGWESADGKESSAPLYWPEELKSADNWHHIVVNLKGDKEFWYIDGQMRFSLERRMIIAEDHRMVLGGASMEQPSFTGQLAALRIHNNYMEESQIKHNYEGGVMLGTKLHINIDPNPRTMEGYFYDAWGKPDPDNFFSAESEYFRHRVSHELLYNEWDEKTREDFFDRIPTMVAMADDIYHLYGERMALRMPIVSRRPEFRGDGIKYKIPIQGTPGANYMGWHDELGFGYACQFPGHINPHELVHGAQGQTGGGLSGSYWEAHANFPQTYTGIYQTVPAALSTITSVFYEAHGRNFYHDRLMFEHLAQSPAFGPMFISKLWYDSNDGEYPWQIFERHNPDSSTDWANEFNRMAQRNVTWDYEIFSGFNKQDPDLYRNNFENGKPGVLRHGRVLLKKIPHEPDWYRPAKENAPQQTGWSIAPLKIKSQTVSMELSGYIDSSRGSNWRASFVAVDNNNQPRYSDIIAAGEMLEFDLEDTDRELYMVVVGTPDNIMHIDLVQDFRSPAAEQFVYKVRLEGAEPRNTLREYYEDKYSLEGLTGTPHSNGGGFVENTASVAASVWVGPEARVLGNSHISGNVRIGEEAIISNSTVKDNALVSGKSVVTNNSIVQDYAVVSGNAEVDGATIQDYARIRDMGRAIKSVIGGHARISEHATSQNQSVDGRAVLKGHAYASNGNITGTVMVDGSYNKGNELTQGRWFQWSWGSGKEPGEYDVDYHGLYMHISFDRNHSWMAWDDFGLTWGYRINDVRSVDDEERGKVLELNGKDQFVELQGSVVDQIDMTLTLMVKWNGGGANQRVFDLGVDEENNIFFTPENEYGKAELVFNNKGVKQSIISDEPLKKGVWSRITLVIEEGANAELYIDNDLVGSNDKISLYSLTRNYNDFTNYLGRTQDGTTYFSGKMDDLMIFTTIKEPEDHSFTNIEYDLE